MTKVRSFYGHQGNIRPPHGLIQAASESEAPESEDITSAEALAIAGVPEELASEILSELNDDEAVSEVVTEVTVDGSTEVPVELVGEPLSAEEEAALEASGEEVPVLTDDASNMDAPEQATFACTEEGCDKSFDSAQGLGSHKRVHKE